MWEDMGIDMCRDLHTDVLMDICTVLCKDADLICGALTRHSTCSMALHNGSTNVQQLWDKFPIDMSMPMGVRIPQHMPMHMSMHMSIHMSMRMPIHKSVHMSIHMYIHMPMPAVNSHVYADE